MGYSILYEYGLFKQKIVDGWQTELPDVWLPGGDVWLVQRTDKTFRVRFDGNIREIWTENGMRVEHYDAKEVEAVAYDMMVSGANTEAVSGSAPVESAESRKLRHEDLFGRELSQKHAGRCGSGDPFQSPGIRRITIRKENLSA